MIFKSDTVSFSWPSECIHASGRHVCGLATSLVQRARHSDLHMKTRFLQFWNLMLNHHSKLRNQPFFSRPCQYWLLGVCWWGSCVGQLEGGEKSSATCHCSIPMKYCNMRRRTSHTCSLHLSAEAQTLSDIDGDCDKWVNGPWKAHEYWLSKSSIISCSMGDL